MKKYFILFLFLLFIIQSIIAQDSLIASKEKADVYIIRNDLNLLLLTDEFYNNDKYIGGLKGLKYLKYECIAGEQLFWAVADNKHFVELTLKPGETYIIEAENKIGLYKGQVKLKLVPQNSDHYKFLKDKIIKNEPALFSIEKIQKINNKRKKFISKSIAKYQNKKRKEISFDKDTISSYLTVDVTPKFEPISYNPIIIDYNFIDLPFSRNSIELSGAVGLITNPSMSQSINIATSFHSFTREGLYRLMAKKPSTKQFYNYTSALASILTYLPIPLTSGWMHEEFHRAVLAKHGGNSYNEMNNFPITKKLISVLDVKDEDLIQLKHDSPQDMVRISEAGIEGEYLLANNINKTAFFYNTKSISYTPLIIALNSSLYVLMCTGKNIDKETDNMNKIEGGNIQKRDLLGLDFLAYTYDLFRSEEPYQNRGIHPSGVGIDRYIKRSQLTPIELSYLKRQGLLQLINFLNPISFFQTSFSLKRNDNSTRTNIYFNHWLTSFGYDISATTLLQKNNCNYAFTLHNYANYYKWFPGVEFETYNFLLGRNTVKKPIPVSAKIMVWLQPKDELFFSKQSQFGGLIELKCYYPINKYFSPYFSLTGKTDGWVAGNVYLESNLSGSFGLRACF